VQAHPHKVRRNHTTGVITQQTWEWRTGKVARGSHRFGNQVVWEGGFSGYMLSAGGTMRIFTKTLVGRTGLQRLIGIVWLWGGSGRKLCRTAPPENLIRKPKVKSIAHPHRPFQQNRSIVKILKTNPRHVARRFPRAGGTSKIKTLRTPHLSMSDTYKTHSEHTQYIILRSFAIRIEQANNPKPLIL
jgi:hypothetical protein